MPTATPRLEADLERFFRHRIRLLGGHTLKLAPTEAGAPDRLVIMPGGKMYLVELKTDAGQLRPIQLVWHRRIRMIGGRVHVIHGRDGVINWLRMIVAAGDPLKKTYTRRRSA